MGRTAVLTEKNTTTKVTADVGTSTAEPSTTGDNQPLLTTKTDAVSGAGRGNISATALNVEEADTTTAVTAISAKDEGDSIHKKNTGIKTILMATIACVILGGGTALLLWMKRKAKCCNMARRMFAKLKDSLFFK